MQSIQKLFIIMLVGLVANTALFAKEKSPLAPVFTDLGSYHRPISTSQAKAQQYFDQGMVLFYGFEWGESIRSFQAATKLDPHCALCYWGLALALGNKMNAPMSGHEYRDGQVAIKTAQRLEEKATPVEKALVEALALRYQHPPKRNQAGAFSCHGGGSFDEASHQEKVAYAQAMKAIVKKFPTDLDAQALYAAALYWGVAGFNASENNVNVKTATAVLKKALLKDKTHVGTNHYFIHVVEPYSHPAMALPSANLFRTLVPGSEHLVHMPAHIYFLTGRYHAATEANLQAVFVYQDYNKTCQRQGFKPEVNYLYFHNYDFLRTAAVMEGRKSLALRAAKQIREAPFAAWFAREPALQWFIPVPYYVQARFGLWREILKEPKPTAKSAYALGMLEYARGLAFVQKGDIKTAKKAEALLAGLIKKGPADNALGESGLKLLNIADAVLRAKIADAEKNQASVFKLLRSALAIQDGMGYHEPPDWYFPLRQALGDAYLKWGQPQQAKAFYEADLKQYPKNPWSLYGLAHSLRALHQNAQAEKTLMEFKEAWKYADVAEPYSLFQ